MPRYFFHVRDGADLITDPEGSDLPDLRAARAEAIRSAREMLGDALLRDVAISPRREFEIANDAGQTVLVVPFIKVLGLDDEG